MIPRGGLFGEGKADEQACMVHVRRKSLTGRVCAAKPERFVDEFERTAAGIAEGAIKQISKLYDVEKQVKGKSPEERVALRQEKAKPIFDDLEVWLYQRSN